MYASTVLVIMLMSSEPAPASLPLGRRRPATPTATPPISPFEVASQRQRAVDREVDVVERREDVVVESRCSRRAAPIALPSETPTAPGDGDDARSRRSPDHRACSATPACRPSRSRRALDVRLGDVADEVDREVRAEPDVAVGASGDADARAEGEDARSLEGFTFAAETSNDVPPIVRSRAVIAARVIVGRSSVPRMLSADAEADARLAAERDAAADGDDARAVGGRHGDVAADTPTMPRIDASVSLRIMFAENDPAPAALPIPRSRSRCLPRLR